jgi:hypothetical protein
MRCFIALVTLPFIESFRYRLASGGNFLAASFLFSLSALANVFKAAAAASSYTKETTCFLPLFWTVFELFEIAVLVVFFVVFATLGFLVGPSVISIGSFFVPAPAVLLILVIAYL